MICDTPPDSYDTMWSVMALNEQAGDNQYVEFSNAITADDKFKIKITFATAPQAISSGSGMVLLSSSKNNTSDQDWFLLKVTGDNKLQLVLGNPDAPTSEDTVNRLTSTTTVDDGIMRTVEIIRDSASNVISFSIENLDGVEEYSNTVSLTGYIPELAYIGATSTNGTNRYQHFNGFIDFINLAQGWKLKGASSSGDARYDMVTDDTGSTPVLLPLNTTLFDANIKSSSTSIPTTQNYYKTTADDDGFSDLVWRSDDCTSRFRAAESSSDWLTLKHHDLELQQGSALDFSDISELDDSASIDIDGDHFAIGGEEKPLLIANILFDDEGNGFVEAEDMAEYVTQLRRHGYNAVRLHFIDNFIRPDEADEATYKTSDHWTVFKALITELKSQNMGILFDIQTDWTDDDGRYTKGNGGTVACNKNYWRSRRLYIHFFTLSDGTKLEDGKEAFNHWKWLVNNVWNDSEIDLFNYEGLLGVNLINEMGILYSVNKFNKNAEWQHCRDESESEGVLVSGSNYDEGEYPEIMMTAFEDWIAANSYTLKTSSSGKYKIMNLAQSDADYADYQDDKALLMQFVSETEQNTFYRLKYFLTSSPSGPQYAGPVAAYNNTKHFQSQMARQYGDFVNIHAYHDHVLKDNTTGNKYVDNTSSIDDKVSYAQYFGLVRNLGKPFIVDEYDHPYWSEWRREAGIAIPSIAALQGWSGIARFKNPVATQLANQGSTLPASEQKLSTFTIGNDPIARASETLAALLFLRGDVSEETDKIGIYLPDQLSKSADSNKNFLTLDAQNVSQLVLIKQIGNLTDSDVSSNTIQPDYTWDKTNIDDDDYNQIDPFANVLTELKLNGVLSSGNASTAGDPNSTTYTYDPNSGIYFETDTGEIKIDPVLNQMQVTTARSEAVVFDISADDFSFPISMDNVTVNESTGSALISVSSLEGDSVLTSNRLLVIVATDAENQVDSDFFIDENVDDKTDTLEKVLLPYTNAQGEEQDRPTESAILIKQAQVDITIQNSTLSNPVLYVLGLNGNRLESFPVDTSVSDQLRFKIDLSLLANGPTTYFELAEAE